MERLTRAYVRLGRYDPEIVKVIKAGSVSPLHTEIWIVPKRSQPPRLEPEAYILDEFGVIGGMELERRISNFYQELNRSGSQGYIINYGSSRDIAVAEKGITKVRRGGCDFDCSRITLVRGGTIRKRSTVVWIVPEGAESPKP